MGHSLDLWVRAGPAAATGAVSLIDHLSAGPDSADNAAHGDSNRKGGDLERRCRISAREGVEVKLRRRRRGKGR